MEVRNEVAELLEAAMMKEIASQAFYEAGQSQTDDPGAKTLMRELAEGERRHYEMLQEFMASGTGTRQSGREEAGTLRISEYLEGADKLEGAGLQDTLIFAMKREQSAVEFYSRMMHLLQTGEARELCERIVREELRHKRLLELFYDEYFYGEM